MSEKSLVLAYVFWLVGGFLGLHHFYLGRDMQGFLWWCTIGGYLGFGWARDLFHIHEYVKQANNDSQYMAQLSDKFRSLKNPPFSALRFAGMIVVAYTWAAIVNNAIPTEEFLGMDWHWLQIFVPLGGTLGVWCVGNIGHEEGAITWPLIASYATYPLYNHYKGDISFTVMILAAAYAFDWKSKQWRRKITRRKSLLKRTTIIGTCVVIYLSLWATAVYFNGTITDTEGEEIHISDAVHHFFNSPWYTDLGQSLWDTLEFAKNHGWEEIWRQVVDLSDPLGENNAFRVLELDSGANQTIINSRCRQLSVKWHPDKVKEPEKKREAQEKFYEVQQACELLSTSKMKRRRKNKKSAT